MSASEALWQSARNLLDAQVNLKKLYDAFSQIECVTEDLTIQYSNKSAERDVWVNPVRRTFFQVAKHKGKKSFEAGWITVAIQLACEEPDAAGEWNYGRQAKVLVGYCPDADWDYRWIFDTADPDGAGECEDGNPQGNLWVYDEDKGGWLYAVQLDALDRPEAVDECLVNPLRALINDGTPEEVLGPIKDKLCIPPQKA